MNKHLKLVREFHDAFSFPQAEFGAKVELSEMAIIIHQALLMEDGSNVLKALYGGDMVEILNGLVDLAYCSLDAVAMQGEDAKDIPISWRHDGHVISLMRLLSEKINQCSSGETDHYSEIYCLCIHLSRSFINADFNKAFQAVHENYMSRLDESRKSGFQNVQEVRKSPMFNPPDLSDYLYE